MTGRRAASIQVEDTGTPHLDDQAPEDQVAGDQVDDQAPDQGEPAAAGEVVEDYWDAEAVEDALLGLWNFQCLYYGVEYAADPGELEKAAQQLVPVFNEHVPPVMKGMVGNLAGAGLIATTGVQMYQAEKRALARRFPRGPLAQLLGRRRPGRPAASQESGAEAAAAPPAGPTSPDGQQADPEQPKSFTAEEAAAIRNHQGGPGDQALVAYGNGMGL